MNERVKITELLDEHGCPRNPTTIFEAAVTLGAFVYTAPGQLPYRVSVALDIVSRLLEAERKAGTDD